MTTRIDSVRALVIMALALLVTSCSGGSGVEGPSSCEGEGCPCIWNNDCSSPDLQCIDGLCVLPAADASGDGASLSDAGDTSSVDDVTEDTSTPLDGSDVTPDGTTTLKAFGEYCTENADCESAWCLDSATGARCTMSCEGGCPDGWDCLAVANTGPDFQYVCALFVNNLCQPCLNDASCNAVGDMCLELGGGTFCGMDCSFRECPEGYSCTTITDASGATTGSQCIPQNGTCDCTDDNTGFQKGCYLQNDLGTCYGNETCDPAQGWIACDAPTPADEVCDGLDNDCDGLVDEGLEPSACETTSEHGTCQGTTVCQGADGWVCTAPEPVAELCDYADNDCDGETDEGFVDETTGLYASAEHCGGCGKSCATMFAMSDEVHCDAEAEDGPSCVIDSCQPGFYLFGGTSCVSNDLYLCEPCTDDSDCYGEGDKCIPVSPTDPQTFCTRDCSPTSIYDTGCPEGYSCQDLGEGIMQCLPVTNACDCSIANAGAQKPCFQTNDQGICFGVAECDPLDGWMDCDAAVPAEESCNGLDDDCDGLVDEGIDETAPCQEDNEWGSCDGVLRCLGILGMVCDAAVPAEESCNGLDDDCDGAVDDGFATLVGGVLVYGLSVDHCGACGYACPPKDHGVVTCDPTPPIPQCVISSCDEGYYDFQGLSCLKVPETLCNPCLADTDCLGPGDACLDYGAAEGSFCGRDCSAGSIYHTASAPCTGDEGVQGCCPDGFTCEAVGGGMQCTNSAGSCDCVEDGLVKACALTNAYGTCYGSQTCNLATEPLGWTACDAPPAALEVCNGMDDDCDGLIDDTDPSLDTSTTPTGDASCSNGPECVGTWRCEETAPGIFGWACDAEQALAQELCDYKDNTCDGVVDEPYADLSGTYLHVEHCGACGNACALIVPHALDLSCVMVDEAPTCVASDCETGYYPFGGGTACLPLVDNLCQPCSVDDDCLVPGTRCVETPGEKFCARDCSTGSPYGETCPSGYTCAGYDGSTVCQPDSGTCVCSDANEGQVRSCTVGSCVGLQTCTDMAGLYSWTECSAEGVVAEVCDGTDNDCDGLVDEGYLDPGTGQYTADEHCGQCYNNCLTLWTEAVHHATGTCDATTTPPQCAIDQCLTEVDGGVTYEWVDVDSDTSNGCECRRVAGTTDDPPDLALAAFPTAGLEYVDANCDGIDGVATDALFVRAGTAVGMGDGSLETPFGTIGEALAALPTSGKAYVLVASGIYNENVVLAPGDVLHGGYSSDFGDRDIVLYPTIIYGQEPLWGVDATLGTVHAEGITGTTTVLSGFVVYGFDVDTVASDGSPGYSSYAIYVADCDDSLVIANNTVSGGRGGKGGKGTDGAQGFGRQEGGSASMDGGAGLDSDGRNGDCTDGGHRLGGSGGTNGSCSGADGTSGADTVCPVYDYPTKQGAQAAYVGADPAPNGAGGYDGSYDDQSGGGCSHVTESGYPEPIQANAGGDGYAGTTGTSGSAGEGCATSVGTVVGLQWQAPSSGTVGGQGDAGASGGGGGGGGGVAFYNAGGCSRHVLGATGGGGGAGGCGGLGGIGGASGGGSFGVFVVFSSAPTSAPEVRDNQIERGVGGGGGAGGYGGYGGMGGFGGNGGDNGGEWAAGVAGKGGDGGPGGPGGGGGGGCGGASVAFGVAGLGGFGPVDYASSNDFVTGDTALLGGTGGSGGGSGTPTSVGTPGTMGLSTNYQAW